MPARILRLPASKAEQTAWLRELWARSEPKPLPLADRIEIRLRVLVWRVRCVAGAALCWLEEHPTGAYLLVALGAFAGVAGAAAYFAAVGGR